MRGGGGGAGVVEEEVGDLRQLEHSHYRQFSSSVWLPQSL